MERLAELYTELGKPDEAAKWQQELEAESPSRFRPLIPNP